MSRPAVAALLIGAAVLAGCTAAPAPEPPAPEQTATAPEPVVPPAACLLDVDGLAATTGLTWAADATTAGDGRCLYDPEPGTGSDFVTVEVLYPPLDDSAPDPPTPETLAQACADGTRVAAGPDVFVCRFPGGGVFAVRDRGGVVVTVASAEVPAGTTADQLAAAFTEQLTATG